METFWWVLSLALMLAGLVGSVLPVLPSSVLILAGALVHHFALPRDQTIGWWTLGVLIVLTVVSYVVDFVAGAVGAKKFGASRWGAVGGLIGSIVGVFFFPVGLFVGPIIGVLVAELLFAQKTLGPAVWSSWGTLLGTVLGMAAKLIVVFAMVGVFFVGWYWGV